MCTALHQNFLTDDWRNIRPHHIVHGQTITQQLIFIANDHAGIRCVDVYDKLFWSATWQTQAPTLTDRHKFERFNCAGGHAIARHNGRLAKLNAIAQESFTTACSRNKANILAVRFCRGAQAKRDCSISHLRLCHMPNRKHRERQFGLIEHIYDITLVFKLIVTASQSIDAVVAARNLCMVTRCHRIKTQISRTLAQSIELQMTIAFDARIRRNAINMRLHIWRDDMLVEVV